MPVEIPLDRICVRTGLLCPSCQRKVREERYTEDDLNVMRALLSLEGKLGQLKVRFVRSYRVDHKLVVLLESTSGTLPVWLNRELQAALDDPTVNSVIVLPARGVGVKELVEAAIRPFKVVDVSKVYSPDGSVYYVVRLPSNTRGKLDAGVLKIVLELIEKRFRAGVYLEYVEEEEEEPGVKISVKDLRSLLDRLDRF